MIDLLLKAGVPLNATDKRGKTALHLACAKSSSETVVLQLLQTGAIVNDRCKEGLQPFLSHQFLRNWSVRYLLLSFITYRPREGLSTRGWGGRLVDW